MAPARKLSTLVLEPDFGAQFSILVANHGADEVQAAMTRFTESLLALNVADRELRGTIARELDTALRPIGAKVSPHLSPEQASAWCDAMVLALSNLPGKIALAATREAIHHPFTALWEVEKKVRDLADEKVQRQKQALFRLEQMLAEIQRAANPPPALEAPPADEDRVWTQDEIDQANTSFRRIHARTRFRLNDDGTCESFELEPGTRDPAPRATVDG